MLLKRTGLPEEGDLLLCVVSKIYFNSVFVNLEEYPGKSGLIHISEIAPGRIRNIRDYVVEGKTIVCKVLRIDQEKGHIDLSLRRVTESQRREKVEEIKQEQKAEKMIEFVANALKQDLNKIYAEVSSKICCVYPSIFLGFQAVAFGETTLEKLGVSKELAVRLTEIITQRIKLPKVEIAGTFTIKTYVPNGITLIKSAFDKASKHSKNNQAQVAYLGGGKYYLTLTAIDYKEAETIMKYLVDSVVKDLKKSSVAVEFERKEK